MRRDATRHNSAFTLIELSVVILIITMMMLMAVPAVSKIVAQARRDLSVAIMRQLESACHEFKLDVQVNGLYQYPRSSDADYPNWSGSQLLRLQLTGYAADDGNDALPGKLQSFETLSTDDGHNGFGFRLTERGRVYGPYNGAENIDFGSRDGHSFFVDAFDHEFYYYRYDLESNDYDDDDNSPLDSQGAVVDVTEYATDPTTNNYYRIKDFVIFSAGPDGYIEAYDPADPTASDDVTNVFPEF